MSTPLKASATGWELSNKSTLENGQCIQTLAIQMEFSGWAPFWHIYNNCKLRNCGFWTLKDLIVPICIQLVPFNAHLLDDCSAWQCDDTRWATIPNTARALQHFSLIIAAVSAHSLTLAMPRSSLLCTESGGAPGMLQFAEVKRTDRSAVLSSRSAKEQIACNILRHAFLCSS